MRGRLDQPSQEGDRRRSRSLSSRSYDTRFLISLESPTSRSQRSRSLPPRMDSVSSSLDSPRSVKEQDKQERDRGALSEVGSDQNSNLHELNMLQTQMREKRKSASKIIDNLQKKFEKRISMQFEFRSNLMKEIDITNKIKEEWETLNVKAHEAQDRQNQIRSNMQEKRADLSKAYQKWQADNEKYYVKLARMQQLNSSCDITNEDVLSSYDNWMSKNIEFSEISQEFESCEHRALEMCIANNNIAKKSQRGEKTCRKAIAHYQDMEKNLEIYKSKIMEFEVFISKYNEDQTKIENYGKLIQKKLYDKLQAVDEDNEVLTWNYYFRAEKGTLDKIKVALEEKIGKRDKIRKILDQISKDRCSTLKEYELGKDRFLSLNQTIEEQYINCSEKTGNVQKAYNDWNQTNSAVSLALSTQMQRAFEVQSAYKVWGEEYDNIQRQKIAKYSEVAEAINKSISLEFVEGSSPVQENHPELDLYRENIEEYKEKYNKSDIDIIRAIKERDKAAKDYSEAVNAMHESVSQYEVSQREIEATCNHLLNSEISLKKSSQEYEKLEADFELVESELALIQNRRDWQESVVGWVAKLAREEVDGKLSNIDRDIKDIEQTIETLQNENKTLTKNAEETTKGRINLIMHIKNKYNINELIDAYSYKIEEPREILTPSDYNKENEEIQKLFYKAQIEKKNENEKFAVLLSKKDNLKAIIDKLCKLDDLEIKIEYMRKEIDLDNMDAIENFNGKLKNDFKNITTEIASNYPNLSKKYPLSKELTSEVPRIFYERNKCWDKLKIIKDILQILEEYKSNGGLKHQKQHLEQQKKDLEGKIISEASQLIQLGNMFFKTIGDFVSKRSQIVKYEQNKYIVLQGRKSRLIKAKEFSDTLSI